MYLSSTLYVNKKNWLMLQGDEHNKFMFFSGKNMYPVMKVKV